MTKTFKNTKVSSRVWPSFMSHTPIAKWMVSDSEWEGKMTIMMKLWGEISIFYYVKSVFLSTLQNVAWQLLKRRWPFKIWLCDVVWQQRNLAWQPRQKWLSCVTTLFRDLRAYHSSRKPPQSPWAPYFLPQTQASLVLSCSSLEELSWSGSTVVSAEVVSRHSTRTPCRRSRTSGQCRLWRALISYL